MGQVTKQLRGEVYAFEHIFGSLNYSAGYSKSPAQQKKAFIWAPGWRGFQPRILNRRLEASTPGRFEQGGCKSGGADVAFYVFYVPTVVFMNFNLLKGLIYMKCYLFKWRRKVPFNIYPML
jgi:hypothetical protein